LKLNTYILKLLENKGRTLYAQRGYSQEFKYIRNYLLSCLSTAVLELGYKTPGIYLLTPEIANVGILHSPSNVGLGSHRSKQPGYFLYAGPPALQLLLAVTCRTMLWISLSMVKAM